MMSGLSPSPFHVRRTTASGPAPWAAACLAFALSLHLLLTAVAGIVLADPAGPIRPLAAADTLLCTGTGMRTLPGSASSGGLPVSADSLCALCVPALPDSLPAGPLPAPVGLAFAGQGSLPARPAPDLPAPHRVQPRGPPAVV